MGTKKRSRRELGEGPCVHIADLAVDSAGSDPPMPLLFHLHPSLVVSSPHVSVVAGSISHPVGCGRVLPAHCRDRPSIPVEFRSHGIQYFVRHMPRKMALLHRIFCVGVDRSSSPVTCY